METNSEEQPSTSKLKIPPIYLHEAGNYNEVLNDIKAITINEFATITKGKFLRVNTSSIEDFRNLTKYYDQQNVKYHTFKNPENNNLSVMIRNIPHSLTETEIKDGLLKLKYPVTKVTRLYNKQRLPIPICAVELQKTEKANEIFQLEKLNYCIVHVEPRRQNTDIVQCKRCQRYGHSKNYCHLEPRCVKCTGSHLYINCPKNPNQPPQCVNCGENHPANYRGCSLYSKISKQPQSYPQQQQHHLTQPNNLTTPRNSNPSVSKRTYRDVVTNSQNESTKTEGETENIIETILKQILNLLIPHIKPLLIQLLPNLLQNGI